MKRQAFRDAYRLDRYVNVRPAVFFFVMQKETQAARIMLLIFYLNY